MNKKLKSILKQSFTPPPTQHGEQFINSISYPKETILELLISQIGFIRKRVWILFMMGVCFAFFYTQSVSVPENIVSGVSAILPFLSLCTISEIYKSMIFNMEELELACKYNLPKISLMRIGILGTVSFGLLFFLVVIVGKSDFGMIRNTIYICVPFLISSYLNILIISNIHLKDPIYVCATISGVVSIFMFLASSSFQFIYNLDFLFNWVVLFVLLIGVLVYNFIRFINSQEELQWNLS